MAEPAWKIAMRERKKQKEEEELKKKAEEEARLASVPAWKRPMLLKKLEAEKAAAVQEQSKTTESSPPLQDKWQKAFQKSSQKTPSSTISEPRPSSSSNSSSTNEQPKVPAWKEALRERQLKSVAEAKKKLEESKQQTPTVTSSSTITVKPLQKQNSLAKMKEQFEKQKLSTASPPPSPSYDTEDNKIVIPPQSSVVLQSPSGSPVILKRITTSSPKSSPKSSPQLHHITPLVTKVESPPLTHTPIEDKPSQQANTSSNTVASSGGGIDETSAEFLAMPAWKREVLLRKKRKGGASTVLPPKQPSSTGGITIPQLRHVQNRTTTSTTAQLNTASNTDTEKQKEEEKKEEEKKEEIKKVEEVKPIVKPEIVNSSENAESSSPKLIQKEGKTLRAPVFKSTGKWANISMEDPEFQKLPLWKQELIKRRNADMNNRTAPPPKEIPKEDKKPSIPPSDITTPFDRLNSTSKKQDTPTLKATPPIKVTPKQEPSREEEESVSSGSKVQALLGRFSSGGVVKRKAPPPTTTPTAPVNGPVTLIDEESSDDEPPERPVMKTTRSSSILKSPEKTSKPRKLRRISWSESNLSHYYPKYDYSDYDDIEQPPVPEDEESTDVGVSPTSPEPAIATPIHPWLSANNTKSPPPATNTLSLSNFGSANSFMSMYTLNAPLPPPISSSTTTPTLNDTKKHEENMSPADVYNNIDSDTAALLF